MSLRHILGLCPLCTLPVAVGQVEVLPETPVEICRKLVADAHEVSRLLRTVGDRSSGEQAAAQLKPLLEGMHRATGQLSRFSALSPEEVRQMEQFMRDLMHITQGYMPVVQRLNEVNAYGAEELIELFQFYKLNASGCMEPGYSEETPLGQKYAAWSDSLDDVLYLLRQVRDEESATRVQRELTSAARRVETLARQVKELQNGLSPRQVESEQLPLQRVLRLLEELRQEVRRVRGIPGVQQGALEAPLKVCEQVSLC